MSEHTEIWFPTPDGELQLVLTLPPGTRAEASICIVDGTPMYCWRAVPIDDADTPASVEG